MPTILNPWSPEGEWSVLESSAEKVAVPPNQLTLANGSKIIKRQFEGQRQHGDIVGSDAGANVSDICDAARSDARLPVEE